MTSAAMWEWFCAVAPELAKVVGVGLATILAREALGHLRLPKDVRAALARLRPLSVEAMERARHTPTPWDDVWTGLADELLKHLADDGVELTPEVRAKVATHVARIERKTRKAVAKAAK